MNGFEVFGQNIAGGPAKPKSDDGQEKPVYTFENPNAEEGQAARSATYALWENFLAVRPRPQARDAQHAGARGRRVHTVNMGVQSYRHGKALFWDKEKRQPEGRRRDAGRRSWEARSKKRGKPNQIIGWKAGDKGSTADPAGLPEARRPVDRRQGPGRPVVKRPLPNPSPKGRGASDRGRSASVSSSCFPSLLRGGGRGERFFRLPCRARLARWSPAGRCCVVRALASQCAAGKAVPAPLSRGRRRAVLRSGATPRIVVP